MTTGLGLAAVSSPFDEFVIPVGEAGNESRLHSGVFLRKNLPSFSSVAGRRRKITSRDKEMY